MSKEKETKNIAIVHDYLHQFGGAEKLLEKVLETYPEADFYTSIYTRENFRSSEFYRKAEDEGRIYTSILQNFLPIFQKYFKHFFWVYPVAMHFLVVKNYDFVFISSTYCGKNVRYENCSKLVHYCNSPSRFLHRMTTETDHSALNPFFRFLIPVFTFWLKWLDFEAVRYLNKNNCLWVSNSKHIQEVVKDVYNTDSIVIYPPVETEKFGSVVRKPDLEDPFYYYFGRISFHKRIDLIIKTCLQMRRKLVITGSTAFTGEIEKFNEIIKDFETKNPDSKGLVKFTGRIGDDEIKDYLSRCRAFLFPGKEDFGIAPVEVLASGTPAIMFGEGGSLEYIQDGKNGLFFEEQTVDSLAETITKFEKIKSWNSEEIKKSVAHLNSEVFVNEVKALVEEVK